MELRKVLALRGPNVWANFPVLEAWVDLGDLKDSPSDSMPGFNDRLMSWLPTMIEHRCSIGERGGFFERLRRGTYLAHILEHVTLELQTLAGTAVGFGRARETTVEGVYRVAIEYEEEELARAALDTAHELCLAAVHDRPFAIDAAVDRLRQLARQVRLEPGMAAVVEAAQQRQIPVRRLARGLVQLGHGVCQHRLLDGQTDCTSALAAYVAEDGDLTRQLLRSVGVPVPEGRVATSAADAWEAAQECGLPVIVRPSERTRDTVLQPNLSSREQVEHAFAELASGRSPVVVQQAIQGRPHRLLLVGARVVAALGQGSPIQKNGQLLHPESAADLPHHTNGHVAPAWTDITDRVHEETLAQALEAARVVGLDVAEVEIMAADPARPLAEQGGAVVSVAARPDLTPYLHASGSPRRIGDAIIEHLFPRGATGRIPLVAVTGVNGKTTTTRLIAQLLEQTGRLVGMTCTDGIYIGPRRIDDGDCSGPQSARSVLQNPRVEAAVLETARGGILREGLGFDRCDVAVVTNIGAGDHLGMHDIDTLEKLAHVKAAIVDVVAENGWAVLNAADPLVANMASRCRGKVIFFAQDPEQPKLSAHRQAGGRAVFVRANQVILAEGEHETPLVALERVPLTGGGRIAFQVENVLAVAAAAWGLDLPLAGVRAGLENVGGCMDEAPGRFNLFDMGGTTVIVDYGHNTSSLACLMQTLELFPHERRLAVYSTAGDRRDQDMIEQGAMLGQAFDHVFLYEDHYLRGRKEGEIMGLLRQGLVQGFRVRRVDEIQGALKAVETALASARPGDLLLIQADEIDETVAFIRGYLAAGHPGREIRLDEALHPSLPRPRPRGQTQAPWAVIARP